MSLRELFWTGQEIYIMQMFLPVIIAVLLLVPVLALVFAFGFYRRARIWKLGQPEDRSGNALTRLLTTLAVAVANIRIIRQKELYPGIMHACLFGGTALLFTGKIIRLVSYLTGITTPPQSIYLFASLISEIGGAIIIIGGCLAIFRRYILKPERLDTKPEDSLVFIWAGIIVLTGFMVKGYRIASSDIIPPDWWMWSPVGYLLSYVMRTFALAARNDILVWHRAVIHTVPAAIILGYMWINRSRLQHIVISPLNIYFRSLKPKGALQPIDLEKTEFFGVSKIENFTWKQLLDLDACTRCGRCQDACPAHFSGKALNPKKVVQDLLKHMQETYPVPLVAKPIEPRKDMLTDVITEEVIWDCTTCRACMRACPVYIEHVDKLIDMRRNLTMERTSIPESGQGALKSLGTRGHPYRGTTATRTDWFQGLGVKTMAEDSNVDILYWVGCSAGLDERNMKIAKSFTKIMQAADIKFAVLGEEETCCGDPARRMGDEYLFQTICQGNVELFKNYNVKKIVTACPHCFNSLKKEYPQFGGNYEVIHHTQFIADLLKSGKLKVDSIGNKKAAYHDSCYLGRYNDIYAEPRQILKSISGIQSVELARCGENSFCCGGGGGHMWLEEDPSKRLNTRRVEEVVQSGADIVATACPYCLAMFEDALKAKGVEETVKARDLSELIAEALSKEKPAN
ncbi:MAG: (Fe-S)-binding protein [Dehalococcoidales bacterium]|nr:(Fe-S)-binding protein [Dehalococcoidales bacterium]